MIRVRLEGTGETMEVEDEDLEKVCLPVVSIGLLLQTS